jgi:transposase
MPNLRRSYTREYKAEAVKMLIEQGISSAEAGRHLGVNSNLILRWKQELVAEGTNAFPCHGNRPPVEEELRRLRAEKKRMQMDRDILKRSKGLHCQGTGAIFAWIFKNKCHWPVRVMCQVLKVSTSGFYKWCHSNPGN